MTKKRQSQALPLDSASWGDLARYWTVNRTFHHFKFQLENEMAAVESAIATAADPAVALVGKIGSQSDCRFKFQLENEMARKQRLTLPVRADLAIFWTFDRTFNRFKFQLENEMA